MPLTTWRCPATLRRIGGALIALFLSIPVHAVDPSKHLTQYAHTSWRVQDGAFRGSPSALTQTVDGYLWIGTLGGVYRFDGVTLALAGFSEGGQMRSPRVVSLLAARDGSLWIGTGADLEHWSDNQLVHYPESIGFIAGIAETRRGAIWFTRDRSGDRLGPICRVEGEHSRCFGKESGIATITSGVAGLPQDAKGRLWFGDEKTIYQWDSETSHLLSKLDIPHTKVDQTVAALQFDATGDLLIGSQQMGQHTGLFVYDGDVARPFAAAGTEIADLSVSSMLWDRQGTLWIGTDNAGLYRVVQGRTEHYRSTDGLTGESVNALFEDNEGDIWVATAGGLDRFRDLKVTTYSSREGLSADLVNAVVGRRDGSVWLSNLHSLDSIKDGVVTSIRAGSGLPGSEAGPLFEDHAGVLWVGIDEALFVYDHGRFTEMMPGYRKQNFSIRAITEDRSGMVWAMNDAGRLFGFRSGKLERELTDGAVGFAVTPAIAPDAKDGIWLLAKNQDFVHVGSDGSSRVPFHRAPNAANVYSMIALDDGSILAGSAIGVAAVRDGRAATFGVDNGLPCAHVWSLIQDAAGRLWLYTECGVVVIERQDWLDWWANPAGRVHPRVIDSLEGAQPANAFFTSTSTRSTDGRLWFANSSVAQCVDPSVLKGKPHIPPIHIEKVLADQRTYPLPAAHLPPNPKSVQVDYTAPSFALSSKIRFRYRLLGHDDDAWVDAGSRRQAFYTDLSPGSYRFEVDASDSDGNWANRPTQLDLDVATTFYQTKWFMAACIVAIGASAWLLYVMRVRRLMSRIQMRVEARIGERERIARDLHDTLLQGLLSASMQLSIARGQLPTDAKAKPLVTRVGELLQQMIEESRNTVRGLRIRDLVDLEQAISQVPRDLGLDAKAAVEIVSTGARRPLRRAIRDEVYWIVRESIANALRHAEASKIETELEYSAHRFRCVVRDDGKGFDSVLLGAGAGNHWGLSGMAERAKRIEATLNVLTAKGAGTEIELSIPARVAYETLLWKPNT